MHGTRAGNDFFDWIVLLDVFMEFPLVFSYGQINKNKIAWRIQIFDFFHFFREKIIIFMSWVSEKPSESDIWGFWGTMTQISWFFREKKSKNRKTKTVTPLDFYLSGRTKKIESKLSKHRGDQFNQKKSIPAPLGQNATEYPSITATKSSKMTLWNRNVTKKSNLRIIFINEFFEFDKNKIY